MPFVFHFSIEQRANREKLQKIALWPLVFCVKICTHAAEVWPPSWCWGAAPFLLTWCKPSAIVIFLQKTPRKRMKCFCSIIHPQEWKKPPTGLQMAFCVFQHKNLQNSNLCTNFVKQNLIASCLSVARNVLWHKRLKHPRRPLHGCGCFFCW